MTFRRTFPLRFSQCDPAGIAYYPRYFEICDAAIEDWTEAIVGVSRRILHMEMALALPTVRLAAEFIAVSRLGDPLDVSVDVKSVGRSSVGLAVDVSSGGERRFTVDYTQVLMNMASREARAWPEAWRTRLQEEMAQ